MSAPRVVLPRISIVTSHIQPRKHYAKLIGYIAFRGMTCKLLSGCFSIVRFMRCERTLSLSYGGVAFFLLKLLLLFLKLLRELWGSDSLLDHCSLRLSREFLFVALWAQF